ncbi:hypothetical protein BDU57DRAFT_45178 [Ampelomyces quisqualis]|uniref:Uncharacterized protein n=1 Tax=Ampelomyces quisqualis TaxID=50730 RepID=A0A6A5R2B6_AMPQU|nr:hypothetical protein BDU57DRAFT_45178 [Ampelomyces quisqualis]
MAVITVSSQRNSLACPVCVCRASRNSRSLDCSKLWRSRALPTVMLDQRLGARHDQPLRYGNPQPRRATALHTFHPTTRLRVIRPPATVATNSLRSPSGQSACPPCLGSDIGFVTCPLASSAGPTQNYRGPCYSYLPSRVFPYASDRAVTLTAPQDLLDTCRRSHFNVTMPTKHSATGEPYF